VKISGSVTIACVNFRSASRLVWWACVGPECLYVVQAGSGTQLGEKAVLA